MNVDLLIQNGLLVDGTGEPGTHGSVAVKDGKIIVTEIEHVTAREVIDASGLVVAPGFIDIHTHSDLTLLIDSRGASKVSQGVTTEIIGNCGLSTAPCPLEWKSNIIDSASILYGDIADWNWTDYREYVQEFDRRGISLNVGFFVGHGTVRAAVMGYEDRKPTRAEMDQMKAIVADGMENGAVGLSSGLIYPPGSFAEIEELVELCSVAAGYGGIYSTHMRDEGDGLLDSIEESLEVARRANIPLQISHLKSTGKRNWGKMKEAVEYIEKARAEGVDVHYDFYPYTASSTYLTALLPKWVHDGGWEKAVERISDFPTRVKMKAEIEAQVSQYGWNNILIAGVKTELNREFEGRTIAELGNITKQEPVDAMLDLLAEEEGQVSIVRFTMSEEDVSIAAAGTLSMVGSDGLAIAKDGVLGRGKPHPRSYGSFPRVFAKFQREQNLFSLEQAVYKMTGAAAQKLNLKNRGFIKDGFAADLVVFDPKQIRDIATFTDPHRYSEGVVSVYINGVKAYDQGQFLNPKSGVVVRPHATSEKGRGDRS